jgi:AcrR family transcriptional regulator
MRPIPDWLAERVEGAAGVFAEFGFDGTRVEDLTEATGVPSSTRYYYFAGKEAVLAFLLQRWLDRVAGVVAETVAGEGSAGARLERVVRTQLALMASGGPVCRVLLAELGRIGRLPDIAKAMNDAFHHPVERLLEAGASDGSLRRVPVETTAAAIFGASTIAGLHYLVAGKVLAVDEVADAVLGLVRGGIIVESGRARRRTAR